MSIDAAAATISVAVSRDGIAFVRFRTKSIPADALPSLKATLKKHAFVYDKINAYRGPSWRLARLVTALRDAGYGLSISPSVQAELGRLAALTDKPGSADLAIGRMDAMEAATGNKFRPYQREDVIWMERTGSCILANEMRTGKTVTCLAMVPPAGAVIVCPLRVRGVWADHIRHWLPWCRVTLDHKRWPAPNEVVVTTYERLNTTPDGHCPDGMLLVADEAHKCKNLKSQRAQALLSVARQVDSRGGRVVCATGSPAQNGRAAEVWALLEIINRGSRLFGNAKAFSKEFNSYYDPNSPIVGPLSHVMTRRTFESVVGALPPYTWEDTPIYLADYQDDETTAEAVRLCDNLWAKYHHTDDPWEAMRQNPTDGAQYSHLRKLLARLKIEATLDWAEAIRDSGQCGVVTSYHREPVLACAELPGWGCLVGGMPEADAARVISDFQSGALSGLACTIGTGGVGLDLSRADNILFVDRHWVPEDNHQMSARIMSVANPRPKFGARLIVDHPIEARVEEILTLKEEAIRGTVGRVSAASAKDDTFGAIPEPEGVDMAELLDIMGKV